MGLEATGEFQPQVGGRYGGSVWPDTPPPKLLVSTTSLVSRYPAVSILLGTTSTYCGGNKWDRIQDVSRVIRLNSC